jgi:hypothetical protein
VAHQHYAAAIGQYFFNGGQCRTYAGIVGNGAILDGHVKVYAYQCTLTIKVMVAEHMCLDECYE